jgi:hypothetical protein
MVVMGGFETRPYTPHHISLTPFAGCINAVFHRKSFKSKKSQFRQNAEFHRESFKSKKSQFGQNAEFHHESFKSKKSQFRQNVEFHRESFKSKKSQLRQLVAKRFYSKISIPHKKPRPPAGRYAVLSFAGGSARPLWQNRKTCSL